MCARSTVVCGMFFFGGRIRGGGTGRGNVSAMGGGSDRSGTVCMGGSIRLVAQSASGHLRAGYEVCRNRSELICIRESTEDRFATGRFDRREESADAVEVEL